MLQQPRLSPVTRACYNNHVCPLLQPSLRHSCEGGNPCISSGTLSPRGRSITADGIAVRSEATRVFGEKCRMALRNHHRPGGHCEKAERRETELAIVGSWWYARHGVSSATTDCT